MKKSEVEIKFKPRERVPREMIWLVVGFCVTQPRPQTALFDFENECEKRGKVCFDINVTLRKEERRGDSRERNLDL